MWRSELIAGSWVKCKIFCCIVTHSISQASNYACDIFYLEWGLVLRRDFLSVRSTLSIRPPLCAVPQTGSVLMLLQLSHQYTAIALLFIT